eukprot:scaffold16010_cov20-Tisochrysis_lutea.AAC.2
MASPRWLCDVPGLSLRRTFGHSDVPYGFVVEVMIPAVCKDIHYKGRATEAWDPQMRGRLTALLARCKLSHGSWAGKQSLMRKSAHSAEPY